MRRFVRLPSTFGTALLGAASMAALLITTAFTHVFRSTLVFGLPPET
jgi:hypothetical protein